MVTTRLSIHPHMGKLYERHVRQGVSVAQRREELNDSLHVPYIVPDICSLMQL